MAIKYFCDMCGKELSLEDRVNFWSNRRDEFEMELCPSCAGELKNFINLRGMGYNVYYHMED